eukprot:12906353-Prorocentrum_lima.AAC.1
MAGVTRAMELIMTQLPEGQLRTAAAQLFAEAVNPLQAMGFGQVPAPMTPQPEQPSSPPPAKQDPYQDDDI